MLCSSSSSSSSISSIEYWIVKKNKMLKGMGGSMMGAALGAPVAGPIGPMGVMGQMGQIGGAGFLGGMPGQPGMGSQPVLPPPPAADPQRAGSYKTPAPNYKFAGAEDSVQAMISGAHVGVVLLGAACLAGGCIGMALAGGREQSDDEDDK